MKKFMLVALALLVTIVSGCSKKTSEQTIGLVVSTLNNPFFVELRDGALEKAEEAGYELIVLDSQNDPAKELANVEDLVSRGVSVIMINPTDSDTGARSAQVAIKAEIPVISLDRNINGITPSTYIASDNKAGGKLAAEYMLAQIAPNTIIAELEGIPGASSTIERGSGFNEALNEAGQKVTVKQTANYDRSQGLTVTENILQANPNIGAIFAHNDEMALGALKAVEDSGKEVVIVGFDATPDAIASVNEGRLNATIAQQPGLIGSHGVDNAIKLIKGEEIPPFIAVELSLVSQQ